jgi:demethylmenaquinone methyltransferase/2-methoxy-6-polyprenyl-1,4-benzoquinol methylase
MATDDPTRVDYAESELRYNRFMASAYRSALATLGLPHGSRGLDVGCGPGGLLPLLDAATGGTGHITGIDISRPHLARAARLVEEHGLAARVRLLPADLREPLPFPDGSFDWAWSADVLWPTRFPDPASIVRELARVVRPGGVVALFFANAYRGALLPGWPHLEHRVQHAAAAKWRTAPRPTLSHEGATTWLRAAGLTGVGVTAHLAQYQAPLDEAARGYLEGYLFPEYRNLTRTEFLGVGGTDEDWERWTVLSEPRSPGYALAQEDYYCYLPGTLAVGRVLK